ncbi:hypothetical protein V1525DRAFT_110122 [Lipomyces kononenkoae]|uniref:Uncharacterized protein n=1 Tax=Lipomyces kononenkoae TaxID=34357 RepID=A0ACC3T3F1_LIPKO
MNQNTSFTSSELLAAARRPLSPDAHIEVPASREEYEHVQDILEEENAKYPRLQYDGWRKVAIIVATPSPLHGQMAYLFHPICPIPPTQVTRNWDGAIRYLTDEGYILMVAVEVRISQTYESLRAAISYSVCALHCRVGITMCMCINEGNRGTRAPTQYYSTAQERETAIQQAERQLRTALRDNPYGPLIADGFIWYGRINRVVVETFRLEEGTCPPDTVLEPRQSFAIVEAGQFVGGDVPSSLAELRVGDCIPTHILSGNSIAATPLNFFSQEWFERRFGHSMLENALQRIKIKSEVRAR